MVAVVVACHGGGAGQGSSDAPGPGAPGAGPDAPAGSDAGGLRRISYGTHDGAIDSEWIYVAPGRPNAPIVVIAHGQGTEHIVNCFAAEPPHDPTVKQAVALADELAREGYTAVAVMYRNAGEGQPVLPEMRLRDTYLRDAAAVLAAARDVRDRRGGDGDVPIALVGHSNGTYAAWWAATDRPELAELQRGLAIRTLVLAGHTANALANLVAVRAAIGSPAKADRQRAILAGTFLAVGAAVEAAGASQVMAEELEGSSVVAARLAPLLSPAGVAAFRAAAVTPVVGVGGACRDGVPAVCDGGCLQQAFARAADPGAVADYLSPTLRAAIDAWDPTRFADPGDANPVVAIGREISPPFYRGRVRAPRGLVEYSANDHVVVPHGQATRDGTIAALRTQGASVPSSPAIATDAHGVCEHGDYWESARACGYADMLAELHAALD